jgi:hypothetical protein
MDRFVQLVLLCSQDVWPAAATQPVRPAIRLIIMLRTGRFAPPVLLYSQDVWLAAATQHARPVTQSTTTISLQARVRANQDIHTMDWRV